MIDLLERIDILLECNQTLTSIKTVQHLVEGIIEEITCENKSEDINI